MQSVVRHGLKASGYYKETHCQVAVPARNVAVRAAAVESPPQLSATDKVRLGNSDLEVTGGCISHDCKFTLLHRIAGCLSELPWSETVLAATAAHNSIMQHQLQ